MNGEHWTVNSDASLENFIKHLRDLYTDKKYIQVKWSRAGHGQDVESWRGYTLVKAFSNGKYVATHTRS